MSEASSVPVPADPSSVRSTSTTITSSPRRSRLLFKVGGIVLLILLLHIPLLMTDGVLAERKGYQQQATNEIADTWGHRQAIVGPVLAVPYDHRAPVTRQRLIGDKLVPVQETELKPAMAYFLPERLAVSGRVNTERRRRGIYETVVYGTVLRLAGAFGADFAQADIAADQIHWGRAQVLLGISDLRGLRSVSPLRGADGEEAEFENTELAGPLLPVGAKVGGLGPGTALTFELEVSLQGSERLEIAPVGRKTTVSLASEWPGPSFVGAYLPANYSATAKGFDAAWEVSHFSRGYPQGWSDVDARPDELLERMRQSAFGVKFRESVDAYRQVERAQKYGVLFFVLVFAVFFLFEVTAGLRIHPLQYAMVGAGLCLFFLGFLALSEIIGTGWAYFAAGGACTLLVSLYAWSFLGTGKRALAIGAEIGATYGYLYFVLKSQDYALIAGTAALFAALALVMFCTRRLNWYELEPGMHASRRPVAGR